VIFLVVGGCFVLLAKVLLTFVIAIGPIAVLCLMSKPTTNFFRAWLPIALNAVALSLVVFLVLGLSFFGLEQLLQAMQSSVAVGAAHPAHVIEAAATYLTFVVVLCIGLYHVVPLTSQVGRVVAAYLARPIASGASNADAATRQGMVARVAELGAQGK
jgi:type IV secretion system protein VirB6